MDDELQQPTAPQAPEKKIILTEEGLQKLKEKLTLYKTRSRKEIADRIRQSKDFGEISENPEYEDAKAEQAFVEGEIASLENMIRNAQVIDKKEIHTDIVSIGSIVRLQNVKTEEELEYKVVGSAEAEPRNNIISNECPLGKAIYNKKKGETITFQAPKGEISYTILKIKKRNR